MNNQDVQQLAVDIRNTLLLISEGKLIGSEAYAKASDLESRFAMLRKSMHHDSGQNSLEGLCCNHNTENCSILTGIYAVNPDKCHLVAQFGGTELSLRIRQILSAQINLLQEKEYFSVQPDNSNELKNTLHIYSFRKQGRSMLVIASLSSSTLFDKGRFIHFGNFLDMLFPTGKDHPCGVIDTFHSIKSYIDRNRESFDLHAQIYLFPELDRIFSHAGTHTLFDVSANIEQQMTAQWGEHIPRFTISLKEYAVIIPDDKGKGRTDLVKSDFFYKGIPLPHVSKSFALDSEDAFYTFIDTLFIMSQAE